MPPPVPAKPPAPRNTPAPPQPGNISGYLAEAPAPQHVLLPYTGAGLRYYTHYVTDRFGRRL